MSKQNFVEVRGTVEEVLPGAKFRVRLKDDQQADTDHLVIAHLAGKMRLNRIMLTVGDEVRVEMTPYDLTKGRITFRF